MIVLRLLSVIVVVLGYGKVIDILIQRLLLIHTGCTNIDLMYLSGIKVRKFLCFVLKELLREIFYIIFVDLLKLGSIS